VWCPAYHSLTRGNGAAVKNHAGHRIRLLGEQTEQATLHSFPIKERLKLQFRAEFFNFPNHPSFGNPGASFGTGTFGSIGGTTTENRDIQFGLKLVF